MKLCLPCPLELQLASRAFPHSTVPEGQLSSRKTATPSTEGRWTESREGPGLTASDRERVVGMILAQDAERMGVSRETGDDPSADAECCRACSHLVAICRNGGNACAVQAAASLPHSPWGRKNLGRRWTRLEVKSNARSVVLQW